MKQIIKEQIIKLANNCGITDGYQHRVIFDESPKIIALKARGIGYSKVHAFKRLIQAILPKYFPNVQRESIIISRSKEQANHNIDYVYEMWSKLKDKVKPLQVTDAKDRLGWDNGNVVFSLPCEPDSVRTYHGHVDLDEFALYPMGIDKKMMTALAGCLTTGGQLSIFSTGYYDKNEFYRIWSENNDFKKIKLPHEICKRKEYRNSIIEIKKTMTPLEFAQEFCCEFIPEESRAIPMEIIKGCINSTLNTDDFVKINDTTWIGIDFAKIIDETIIIVLKRIDNIFKIHFIKVFKKTDYREQLEYIDWLVKELSGCIKLKFDETGVGVAIAEDLKKKVGYRVEGVVFTNQTKERLFQKVKFFMMDGRLEIPDNEDLIEQIHKIDRIMLESGAIQYRGKKDDMFWALALAIDCIEGELEKYEIEKMPILENKKREEVNLTTTNTDKFKPNRWRGMFK